MNSQDIVMLDSSSSNSNFFIDWSWCVAEECRIPFSLANRLRNYMKLRYVLLNAQNTTPSGFNAFLSRLRAKGIR